MEGKLNIKVKHMQDKPIDLTVNKADSVAQIKEKLASLIGITASEQKLICKGKILKDEDKAGDVLEEGTALHAVSGAQQIRNKSATASQEPKPTTQAGPTAGLGAGFGAGAGAGLGAGFGAGAGGAQADPFAAFGGAGGLGGFPGLGGLGGFPGMGGMDPEMIQGMLNNPEAQAMMQQMFSNPEMLRQMINSHPQLQAMVNSNPQMRAMFDNPEALRMMGQMMSNPALLGTLSSSQVVSAVSAWVASLVWAASARPSEDSQALTPDQALEELAPGQEGQVSGQAST